MAHTCGKTEAVNNIRFQSDLRMGIVTESLPAMARAVLGDRAINWLLLRPEDYYLAGADEREDILCQEFQKLTPNATFTCPGIFKQIQELPQAQFIGEAQELLRRVKIYEESKYSSDDNNQEIDFFLKTLEKLENLLAQSSCDPAFQESAAKKLQSVKEDR